MGFNLAFKGLILMLSGRMRDTMTGVVTKSRKARPKIRVSNPTAGAKYFFFSLKSLDQPPFQQVQ